MRTLVTGADGFVGRHAVERLRAADVEVIAFTGDVREPELCRRQVRAARPDSILHLAAIASVADAWRNPDAVGEVNVGGTRNLLAAVAEEAPSARFVLVSSGEVYGAVPEDRQPIVEDTQPSPPSPYAESKLEAETIALRSGVDAVIARPFPHMAPARTRASRSRRSRARSRPSSRAPSPCCASATWTRGAISRTCGTSSAPTSRC